MLRETDFCAKMLITYHHVVYTITLIFMSRIQIWKNWKAWHSAWHMVDQKDRQTLCKMYFAFLRQIKYHRIRGNR